MKATPKSCSCKSCRRGKASAAGKHMMKLDERAFRHAAKIKLAAGNPEHIAPAPAGGLYD